MHYKRTYLKNRQVEEMDRAMYREKVWSFCALFESILPSNVHMFINPETFQTVLLGFYGGCITKK